ncbi:MAG TPA: sensor domain-containing diguanylate cyclase [Burkholderiaceae bacterium]|nr:sensor domain-containing diguanylate cyclase [Burkholderiaceae bacterium]
MANTLESLRKVFDLLPDAVVMVDKEGIIVLASAAVKTILGYEPHELVGQSLGCLVPQRYRSQHQVWVQQFRESGQSGAMSTRPLLPALCKDGSSRAVSIAIGSVVLEDQRLSVAVIRDAQPLHQTLQGALTQARRDALTGMRNRLDFSVCLRQAIEDNVPFGLLYLDLKDFKPFNDCYGHQTGDEVLRVVAQRIGALVRAEDVAARLGGDEFAMLLRGLGSHEPLRARAQLLADRLAMPFHLGEILGSVGVNIGAALYPADGRTQEALLATADRRMYEAKRHGQALWTQDDSCDPSAPLD